MLKAHMLLLYCYGMQTCEQLKILSVLEFRVGTFFFRNKNEVGNSHVGQSLKSKVKEETVPSSDIVATACIYLGT